MNLSGYLRHRIDIQVHEDTQDSNTGEVVVGWTTVYSNVPAKIEPLSVREFMQSRADQSEISARITIRYKAGLNAGMRILHGSTVYNPAGFLADKKSGTEYLTIPCSQGVNEG
jgi:SPP1 family predicted phage head-tail adaptor